MTEINPDDLIDMSQNWRVEYAPDREEELLDYFAGKALTAMISYYGEDRKEWLANKSFDIAEAMLEERNKRISDDQEE